MIDATGKWVTPGIIDVHSHLGVYASPGVGASSDGNEMTDPVTPNVWAEHAIWPQDPGFEAALAGGVTSMQILPGSGNLIGGRGVTIKNVPAVTYQAMKFPGRALGPEDGLRRKPEARLWRQGPLADDPHGQRGRLPRRLHRGAVATCAPGTSTWPAKAKSGSDEGKKKKDSDAKDAGDPPSRDLGKETLMGAMKGDIRVHIHCYRADEMAIMLDLAKEFGFKVAAFHHGVEAYKIADRLAAEGVCGALWADWWGFKMEALDGIEENVALVDRPVNGCAIVHSDSSEGIQRLNQEAAKVMAHSKRIGLDASPEHAIRWLTANPAKALGIDSQTGTLEAGKMARRRALERHALQRLCACRKSLRRRRAAVRPQRQGETAEIGLHARPGSIAMKRLLFALALVAGTRARRRTC